MFPVGDRPLPLSCWSCLPPDCPCLALISHLSLPWAQTVLSVAAQALASLLPCLDPQNIALYEWLPSFLQKTPPGYTGKGVAGETPGLPWGDSEGQWSGYTGGKKQVAACDGKM